MVEETKTKTYCVYKILDLRNDQVVYIGKTCNFNKRKSAHFTQDKRPVDQYMFEQDRHNFEMTIIQNNIESNDEALKVEDAYILEYQPIMNKNRSGNIKKDDPKEYYNTEKWRGYRRDYYREYYQKKKLQKEAASTELF